jgi:hypothetical protein
MRTRFRQPLWITLASISLAQATLVCPVVSITALAELIEQVSRRFVAPGGG